MQFVLFIHPYVCLRYPELNHFIQKDVGIIAGNSLYQETIPVIHRQLSVDKHVLLHKCLKFPVCIFIRKRTRRIECYTLWISF